MRTLMLGALAAAAGLSACTDTGYGTGFGGGGYRSYDWNRPDPSYGDYYADRYYRGGNYRERRLSRNDRVYRGQNGQYYCRRSDGTTGLIVGGIAGSVLGNIIAPGRSETLGTLLGAAAGAVAGREIERNQDRNQVRCR
ncbi:glycine zipper 2TM domain-containing protein [Sphingomonas sp. IC-56]|uniref:glycine zipper 2TM domain-containing protein n=1 Tax=Sphingomonas sp. IC-56 TaxID=2898529 RepID=UPI001E65D588|nr:glycine zipper 2TM domain-containing protein [Sphingomonas sp. IC-56]MCD2324771.1 glycine zipper 2TM domain-containing protein [Sphingomonas sp. IC-56]